VSHLPNIIPLFPLPNFVLFPSLTAPLHIFEPRYRAMVADASQGDGIIGMTMLKGDWERDYAGNPGIYATGCAGRITTLARLPDGRFNLMLEGIAEFRVLREMRDHAYRTAEVEWCETPPDNLDLSASVLANLQELFERTVGKSGADRWRSLVEERGLRGAALINFLCFNLDINPIEKQTLLEAGPSRVICLIDVLTFKLEERKLGPDRTGGSGPLQ
jgi:Lon protease-like protein